MLQTVRMAVIGAGYWGTKLVHEYSLLSKAIDGVSLDWVADISSERLNVLRLQLGNDCVNFCNDYREVLRDSKIDAVHIALPNHLHYEAAKLALELGKHVLVEKPLTTSSKQALELADLAEEKRLVLQVGHIFRFNNSLRKVKEILAQEVLGPVFYARLEWATWFSPPSDRDIVFDLGPHPIDVLHYVLDSWPITLNAVGKSYLRGEEGKEEMMFVNLEFPRGILASVYASWIDRGAKERSLRLVGEKASLECDALNQTVAVSSPEEKMVRIDVSANNTIRDMQLHFLGRIRGSRSELNGAMVGVTTVQILEAITQSIRTRSPVNLGFV
jgi:predicted dehydrogenase